MPHFIDFRINGRIPIGDDDLARLASTTAGLSNIVAQLRALGMIGEYKSKIIRTRSNRRQEEIPLLERPVPPLTRVEVAELDPDRFCTETFNHVNYPEPLRCLKARGHQDWHETADGFTWPASRPAALPHPEPGGEPLKDRGPGLLEGMGLTPAFEYHKEDGGNG